MLQSRHIKWLTDPNLSGITVLVKEGSGQIYANIQCVLLDSLGLMSHLIRYLRINIFIKTNNANKSRDTLNKYKLV